MAVMAKLHVAVIWHMHQPLYKDRLSGRYLMPWVRLHAIKDYLDMLRILDGYPRIRQTFNLVPSLLEQLEDYGQREAWDRALELTVKPVGALTRDDRTYLLQRFFDLDWERMAYPYPRYAELANQRTQLLARYPVEEAIRHFKEQDWLDLTTWFNLAWFDPMWQEQDPDLAALVARGKGFQQGDRELLVNKQRELIRRIVPTYRERWKSGQVELTTTPFYHPILPLLCDTDEALVARPGLPLPGQRFSHPEDAADQLARGIAYFSAHLGQSPCGLWPSEQSVSPAVVAMAADAGIRWMASDEGILANTLGARLLRDGGGRLQDPRVLYRPYRAEHDGRKVAMVFRDIVLSDLIGFSYAHMAPEDAAADLLGRLHAIADAMPDEEGLVTIALDGENCWEHYEKDGSAFLHAFYRRASADDRLEFTTVSAYLDAHPPQDTLPRLFSGSWIGSDFTTWIGEPTKNKAWDLLGAAREALMLAIRRGGVPAEQLEQAREEIRIAEGSDWFWWFGEGHDSGQDELFDWQFRLHLQNVYRLIGEPVPTSLMDSVYRATEVVPEPVEVPISPAIRGYGEQGWEGASTFDPGRGQGAMHAQAKGISLIRYGSDAERLYLKIGFAPSFSPDAETEVAVYLCYPQQPRVNSPINFRPGKLGGTAGYHFAHEVRVGFGKGGEVSAEMSFAGECATWHQIMPLAEVAYRDELELAIPWRTLCLSPGQRAAFVVLLARGGEAIEVWPGTEPLGIRVPLARATMASPVDQVPARV